MAQSPLRCAGLRPLALPRLLGAGLVGATLLAASSGCPPRPAPEPIAPGDPIAARSRAGATVLDVRRLEGRPRLTMIGRQGDPRPALVAAIAAGQGPEMNAALAGLLAGRLQAAGVPADVLSDGAGMHVRHLVSDDEGEAFLSALAVAMAAPLSAGESALRRAEAHVEALAEQPLDAPALVPLARCERRGAALAKELRWRNDAPGLGRLETARREGLTRDRTALAVVGTEDLGEAIASTLASVEGWPEGSPAPLKWPASESHGAFRSTSVRRGQWRLDLAMRVGSAVDAAGFARRLRRTAPLHGKLGALPRPWRITRAQATALPHGGCLSLRLSPIAAGLAGDSADPMERAVGAAAQVARVVEAELRLALSEPSSAFEVTREIIEADTALEVASRAAWWVLSQRTDEEPVAFTALATSAEDALPTSPDDEALTTAYRDAIARTRLPPTDTIAERVVSVEPGQGQLWLLVANPCALAHEGLWDAGRAALGAAAAAATASVSVEDVEVEPWVSGDGVGILARGGLRHADEPAAALARRVADAAGQAYTHLDPHAGRFEGAKEAVLAAYGGERGLALATFAQQASPSYPGWLAPWGVPGRVASVSAFDARQRWAEVVQGPTRIAVLANHDAGQAELAARRLERWLPPTKLGDDCPERAAGEAARPGVHPLQGGRDAAATAAIGVAFPADERPFAELVRAWLLDRKSPLRAALGRDARRLEVQVVEGGGRAALVILAQTSRDRIGDLRDATRETLVALGRTPPASDIYERAMSTVTAEALARQARPKSRLSRLWRGRADVELPSHDAWTSWLGKQLAPAQIIVVSEHLDEPENE